MRRCVEVVGGVEGSVRLDQDASLKFPYDPLVMDSDKEVVVMGSDARECSDGLGCGSRGDRRLH